MFVKLLPHEIKQPVFPAHPRTSKALRTICHYLVLEKSSRQALYASTMRIFFRITISLMDSL